VVVFASKAMLGGQRLVKVTSGTDFPLCFVTHAPEALMHLRSACTDNAGTFHFANLIKSVKECVNMFLSIFSKIALLTL